MKLHVNSFILDVKLRYMCMDVNYFNLNKNIDKSEYIMIQIAIIPQEFVYKYNLQEKSQNEYIYVMVIKEMYGLPQAVEIARDALVKYLEPY